VRPFEAFRAAPVHTHHIDLRIHDPILRYAESFVEAAFDRLVTLAGRFRPNLDDQTRVDPAQFFGTVLERQRPRSLRVGAVVRF
jgi:hypothetical protein